MVLPLIFLNGSAATLPRLLLSEENHSRSDDTHFINKDQHGS